MKRLWLALVAITLCFGASPVQAGSEKFLIYYGADENPSLAEYDTLVFDSDNHPSLPSLIQAGKTVLGYVSLGEVEENRSYFKLVDGYGILGKANPNWKDARFVDVRDPRWQQLVVGTLVPSILKQGFSGIFLDTLDDPIERERSDPKHFSGSTAAAIALVKAIHAAYPGIPIMLNRGYEILPQVAEDISAVLAESLISDYDFDKHAYRLVPRSDVTDDVQRLHKLVASHPALKIYTLDYWEPSDKARIRRIYEAEEKSGFIPYVATLDLNHIVPRPQ